MKFSGKMCFKIILKVTKKPWLHPLYRRYVFQKTTGGVNLTPNPLPPLPEPPSRQIRLNEIAKYLSRAEQKSRKDKQKTRAEKIKQLQGYYRKIFIQFIWLINYVVYSRNSLYSKFILFLIAFDWFSRIVITKCFSFFFFHLFYI